MRALERQQECQNTLLISGFFKEHAQLFTQNL